MAAPDGIDLLTSWSVLRGSLAGAVSFESSSDDSPTVISGGLILTRPISDDPSPCEVTVCFRKKHAIHRVYVRSTARIYEIYYSYDQRTCSNEYLCTVPCGASVNEVKLPSTTYAYTGQSKACNDGNSITCKDDSACCDLDGWVEVKYLGSVLDKEADFLIGSEEINTNIQTLHEATAEISDLSPVVSITFRLLSIQAKSCVCIEEIYVHSDPAESIITEPSVGLGNNLTRNNPLLSMLVPSLLQLSKSGYRRDDSSGKCGYSHDVERVTTILETDRPHVERLHSEDEQEMEPVFKETRVAPEDLSSKCPLSGSDQGQMPKSYQQKDNQTCSCAENVLNDLVSRMGRIEAFCSRFEESMMKPISCIEQKLLQLEEKFDVLTARFHFSEPIQSLNISSPKCSFGESDSKDNKCKNPQITDENYINGDMLSSITSPVGPQILRSFVINAPEFSFSESSSSSHVSISALSPHIPEPTPEVSSGDSILPNVTSVLDPDMSQSSVFRAPEFFVDDDESISTDDSNLADVPCDKPSSLPYSTLFPDSGDTIHLTLKGFNNANADSSLHSALASNLAALMSSMNVKSSASFVLPINLNEESNNIPLTVDPVLAAVVTGDPSESNDMAHEDSEFENGVCAASPSFDKYLKEPSNSFTPSDNGALASVSIDLTLCTAEAICDSELGASRCRFDASLKGYNCLSQSDNSIHAESNDIAHEDSEFENGVCATSSSFDKYLKEHSNSFTPSDNDALASVNIDLTLCTADAICDSELGPSRCRFDTSLKGSNCLSQSDNSIHAFFGHSEKSSSDNELQNSGCGMLDRIEEVVDLGNSSLLDNVKWFPFSAPSKSPVVVADPEFSSDSCDYINCNNNISFSEVKSNMSNPGLIDYLGSRSRGNTSWIRGRGMLDRIDNVVDLGDSSPWDEVKFFPLSAPSCPTVVVTDPEFSSDSCDYINCDDNNSFSEEANCNISNPGLIDYLCSRASYNMSWLDDSKIIQNQLASSCGQFSLDKDVNEAKKSGTLVQMEHDYFNLPFESNVTLNRWQRMPHQVELEDSSSASLMWTPMLNKFESQVNPIGSVDKDKIYMGAGDISLGSECCRNDADHNWGVDNRTYRYNLVKSALEYGGATCDY